MAIAAYTLALSTLSALFILLLAAGERRLRPGVLVALLWLVLGGMAASCACPHPAVAAPRRIGCQLTEPPPLTVGIVEATDDELLALQVWVQRVWDSCAKVGAL